MFGDQSLSFDRLRWYVDAAMNSNPDSCLSIEYNSDSGRFKRIFIALHACIEGFKHCRPLIFLDGMFLKSRYKGNLLEETGKNVNQGVYISIILNIDFYLINYMC